MEEFFNVISTYFELAIMVIFANFVTCSIVYLYFRSKIKRYITELVTSPAVGVASPLALMIEAASKTAGRTIAMEVKTTLMGKASVTSRQEAGIVADIAGDQLQAQMPLMSGLLDTMPSLKKRLLKNPGLLASIAGALQSVGTGSGGNHQGSDQFTNMGKYNKYK